MGGLSLARGRNEFVGATPDARELTCLLGGALGTNVSEGVWPVWRREAALKARAAAVIFMVYDGPRREAGCWASCCLSWRLHYAARSSFAAMRSGSVRENISEKV